MKLSKGSKIVIVLALFITISVLGWLHIHNSWVIEVDCMPQVGGTAQITQEFNQRPLLETVFEPKHKCGSY